MSDEFNCQKYLPTIDAILSVADFEQITVKRIRNALQELFGVNLQPHTKEINDIILERYYKIIEKRAEEESSVEERNKEIERQDALMAARLSKTNDKGPITRTKKKQIKKQKSVSERAPSSNGFNREMALSAELQDVIGQEKCSRPQVVKLLWAYIKDKNLQNPDDKRQITCDEKLQRLFKKKAVGAFEMNKILSNHIFKPEEVTQTSESVKDDST